MTYLASNTLSQIRRREVANKFKKINKDNKG